MQDETMPDLGRTPGGDVEPLPPVWLMVPAEVVDWLRRGVYAEIGWASEALHEVAYASDREACQGRFRKLLKHLEGVYALMEAIGWARMTPPVAVRVDLGQDARALVKALDVALLAVEHNASEDIVVRGNAGVAGSCVRGGCEGEIERRVEVLCEFIGAVQVQIDALAVRERGSS